MFSTTNRARIHAEKQKKKKKAKKQSKKEIPQKKTFGLKLPKFISQALGIKEDDNPDLAVLGAAENKLLKELSFGYFDKINFLDLFRELCGEGRSRVTYRAFCLYFKFKPDKWIRRLFDLINSQVTGSFTFLELIQFCSRFLYIDRDTTEEFCFRFLSRRGLSFMPQYSILDLDDFVTFVALRYRKYSKLPKQRKLALDIFTSIDFDGDGGVTFDEFQKYCRQNPVFLKLSHPLQNHLRKCIFGIEFWVEKSRAIKTARGSAFEVISKVGGRINRESELYTLRHIEDPVIDKNGYALKTRQKPPKDEEEDDSDAESDEDPVNEPLEEQQVNQPETDTGNDESKEPSEIPEINGDDDESMAISRNKLTSIVAKDVVEDPNKELLVLTNNNKVKVKDTRKKIAFFGTFSIEDHLKNASFKDDFPDITRERMLKRKQRFMEAEDRKTKISALTNRTYVRLVIAISDLISQRVASRMAFNRWLEALQLQSKALVQPPNYTGLRKAESKYRSRGVTTFGSQYNVGSAFNEMPKFEEDKDEDDSINDEDVELEDNPMQFAPLHEQIKYADEKRHKEAEQARVNAYVQEYLFDKYTMKARTATSVNTLQVWAQEAQEDLARFSVPDKDLLFHG